jgi:hypothetical protein
MISQLGRVEAVQGGFELNCILTHQRNNPHKSLAIDETAGRNTETGGNSALYG